jgi:signal peptidase I
MSASLSDARTLHLARAERQKAAAARWLRVGLAAAAMALTLRSFVYEPVTLPSESMLPGLVAGDYLLVAKWPYGYGRYSLPVPVPVGNQRLALPGAGATGLPVRGDVIVFKTPRDNRTDYIKRVIGLPGDRVAMTGGEVTLNGAVIVRRPVAVALGAGEGGCARPCRTTAWRESLGARRWLVIERSAGGARKTVAPLTVPGGHVFVLGDNRDNSADSRFSVSEGGVGLVPIANIVGRADIVFFSSAAGGSIRAGRIGMRL